MIKQIILIILLTFFSIVQAMADSNAHNIAGFISQGFMYTDDNNFYTDTTEGSFQFNELGININKRISPKMKAGIQFISYTIGELGKNQIEVDWGFADFRYNQYIGIRGGILKSPHGLYNETRDIDSSLLYIYLPSSVYAIQDRDTILRLSGVSVYGEFSTGIFGDINYQLLAGRPDMDENKGTPRTFEDNSLFWDVTQVKVDTNYLFDLKWYSPLEGLLLCGNYRTTSLKMVVYMSDFDQIFEVNIPKANMSVLSAKYEMKNLILNYEFYTRIAKFTLPDSTIEEETKARGWYASVKYILSDYIQAGIYYSEFYENVDDKRKTRYKPDSKAWQEEICLSIRFDITDSWIFKLENHWLNGTHILFRSDHMDKNGNISMKENWYLFASKLSYTF